MYKTGVETKAAIVESAKKLFYSVGYRETTVKQICAESGTKLGTFTYYFKKKEDLFGQIYSSYMDKCCNYVDSLDLPLSDDQKNIYSVMLYYYNLYRDARIVSFHREALLHKYSNFVLESPREVVGSYSGTLKVSDPRYRLAIIADDAIRRELNLRFIDIYSSSGYDVRNLLKMIYFITARLFGSDEETLRDYIEESYEYFRSHPAKDITLL
ncbi:MAG: TetR/AcrR family transcriptional regulator [Erysipelotrichaceae bacterium]|nr:TetR/AcrR family transcriptional regulator [Erysipelotrichaceae bacterium]